MFFSHCMLNISNDNEYFDKLSGLLLKQLEEEKRKSERNGDSNSGEYKF